MITYDEKIARPHKRRFLLNEDIFSLFFLSLFFLRLGEASVRSETLGVLMVCKYCGIYSTQYLAKSMGILRIYSRTTKTTTTIVKECCCWLLLHGDALCAMHFQGSRKIRRLMLSTQFFILFYKMQGTIIPARKKKKLNVRISP